MALLSFLDIIMTRMKKKKKKKKEKKKHNEDECINAFKFLLYDGLYKEPFIHSVRYCLLLDRNLCKYCMKEKREKEKERSYESSLDLTFFFFKINNLFSFSFFSLN